MKETRNWGNNNFKGKLKIVRKLKNHKKFEVN